MSSPRPDLIFDFVSSACQAWIASKWTYASTYNPLVFVETGSVILAAMPTGPKNEDLHIPGLSQVTDLLSGSLLMSTQPSWNEATQSKSQDLALDLMSRGVSPWGVPGLSSSMLLALTSGCDQFVSAALQVPDAPSVESLLSAEDSSGQDALSILASSPYGAPVLSAILPSVSSLPSHLVARALKVATTATTKMLLPFTASLSVSQVRRVHQAWSRRFGEGSLRQEDLSVMLSDLQAGGSGVEVSPAEMTLASRLTKLARTPWPSSGEAPFSLEAAANMGAAALSARFEIPSGPMSGSWTGLAAACAYLLKRTSRRGVYPVQLTQLLDPDASTDTDISKSLGVSWRPGIALDGIIWLALHGREEKSGVIKTMSDFSAAAKLSDPAAWEVGAVGHAKSFTLEMMARSPASKSGFALATAWRNALSERADLLKELDWNDQEKLALARSVNINFSSVVNMDGKLRNACVDLFELLFPNIRSTATLTANLDPEDPHLPSNLAYLLTLIPPSLSARHAKGEVLNADDHQKIPLLGQKSILLEKITSTPPGSYPPEVVEVLERWGRGCVKAGVDADHPDNPSLILGWCKASRLAGAAVSRPRQQVKRLF